MQIEAFVNYISFERRYSKHTILSYSTDLEQFRLFLKDHFGKEEIPSATHIEIRSWMVSLMEEKISPRSINRKISTLKSFFKFMIRKGVVTKNPLAKVLNPKTAKRLPVFVEKTNMEQLLKNIQFSDDFEGFRDKTILDILYNTGIRRSELLGLKDTDIDSYNSQIKVLGKGNKERIIPISPQLIESIKNYIHIKKEFVINEQSSSLFVTKKGKPLQPIQVYHLVKKYLSMVTSIEKKSPHVLRHTFATHLMNNGADINAVKELLGHSSLAATQVYTHNTIDKLKSIYKQAHPKA